MNDNFAENLAKPCQKADQLVPVAAAFGSGPGFLALNRVKGGVNLDHFGGAKVDQLVKG